MSYSETTNVHHSFANSFLLPSPGAEKSLLTLLAQLTLTSRKVDKAADSLIQAIKLLSAAAGFYFVCSGVARLIESSRGSRSKDRDGGN
jgi:hypothetical protein